MESFFQDLRIKRQGRARLAGLMIFSRHVKPIAFGQSAPCADGILQAAPLPTNSSRLDMDDDERRSLLVYHSIFASNCSRFKK
jgi:hypothetical protein